MKRSLTVALVAFALLAGVGAGFVINAIGDPEATADNDPPTTSQPNEPDQDFATIVPGAVTPVATGMSIDEAVDTGWIVKDVERSDSCEADFWKWTGDEGKVAGLDILVDPEGTVVSIGVREPQRAASDGGLATAKGIGLGSTLAELREAYGDQLIGPEQGDYGQTNYYVRDDADWMGFLFNETPDDVTDGSKVTFIEVTRGNQPGLIRDGC